MAEKVATVYIHGGDYDCSEAVRMCYRAVGVLPYGSYMWTGNEVELLEEHDFIEVGLFEKLPGDVLWKPGHTEMYLGDGMQGGARIAENGGTTGKKGDQTGNEICRSKFDQSYWKWKKCLRYVGGMTVNGIPANVAAVQVMNHLIDHPAHGYSQPNRGGDGTVEAVEVTWNDEKRRALNMDCIISIHGANTLVWFDGENINDLSAMPDVNVLDKISRVTTGANMPRAELTQEEFAYLCQAIRGSYPKHLKSLVTKYAPRSPECD